MWTRLGARRVCRRANWKIASASAGVRDNRRQPDGQQDHQRNLQQHAVHQGHIRSNSRAGFYSERIAWMGLILIARRADGRPATSATASATAVAAA